MYNWGKHENSNHGVHRNRCNAHHSERVTTHLNRQHPLGSLPSEKHCLWSQNDYTMLMPHWTRNHPCIIQRITEMEPTAVTKLHFLFFLVIWPSTRDWASFLVLYSFIFLTFFQKSCYSQGTHPPVSVQRFTWSLPKVFKTQVLSRLLKFTHTTGPTDTWADSTRISLPATMSMRS